MENNHSSKFDAAESLRKIELFKALDDETFGLVSSLVKWKRYQEGTEIIPYMSETDEVYFIASGCVRVTIFSFSGKEISYQELGPGEMFGELSAIDQSPRAANVIALEPALIGMISGAEYWKLIDRYPSVARATLKRLASMIRFLIDRIYQYGALDVKDRIRMEVLRLARESMSNEDTADITNFPTHQEIANRVNTHREAVTRELNELTRIGLIEQNQRVLTVKTVAGLTELLAEYV
ncbi:MAG: Crp/Fnr family transcriptional regulator [Gammaproteobacteria bacterium]|nr:Crp/Fnr family transcriptional regulator [Gammaproteobacteria bacterium]